MEDPPEQQQADRDPGEDKCCNVDAREVNLKVPHERDGENTNSPDDPVSRTGKPRATPSGEGVDRGC